MIIVHTTKINNDNSITFKLLSVFGEVEEKDDGFLKIINISKGFCGSLGYGELILMINENSSGEIISPSYEHQSDRLELISKINNSINIING